MTPDLALVVLFGALGGSLFGYDLGLIGGVLASLNGANATRSEVSPPYPEDTIYLDEIATELVVGGCKVGAALGALLCMWLLPCGHHTCFVFSGVAYVLGPVIMATAPTWPVIFVGRVVTGIGVGASAVASPAYLGEVAPAAVRGAIVATYELALCLGLVAAVLVDWLLALDVSQGFLPQVARWRIMLALPAVPGMLVLFGCLLLPPSPLRLVQLGREAEAYELMLRLQLPRSARAPLLLEPLVADAAAAAVRPPSANTEGVPSSSSLELEVAAAAKAAINAAVRARGRDVTAPRVGLRALYFGRERRAAWLLSALALCNQANGSSTVVNYASQLLRDTGQLTADDATVLSACVGATKLIGVLIAMRLVDCLGRRPLLIAGAVLTAASLLGTAAAMQAEPPSPYLLLLGLAAFVLFYGLSLAPVFFVLLSEVFTDSAKPVATGTLLALTFLGGAVIDSTFNSMLSGLGDWGTFCLLAAVCLAGGAISYAALPETKGRTLWEVQRLLGGGGITHALISFHQGHPRLEACKPAGSKRFSSTPSALLLAGTSFGGSFASGGGSYAAGACSGHSSFLGSRQGSQAVAYGSSTTRPLLPSNGADETLADDAEAMAETDAELNALLRKMSSAVVLAA